MPTIKPEDMQHFKSLLEDVDESELTSEQIKERKIMEMLLKVTFFVFLYFILRLKMVILNNVSKL